MGALKLLIAHFVNALPRLLGRQKKLIFISYRHGDAAGITARIRERLEREFGKNTVFTDVNNIPAGKDFVDFIKRTIAQCDAFLVIMGHDWLTAKDDDGNRRLDKLNDFVRLEIESVLNREIPVIPVFINDAKMPAKEQLPESLQKLARRSGLSIQEADPYFDGDIKRLIMSLEGHLGTSVQNKKFFVRIKITFERFSHILGGVAAAGVAFGIITMLYLYFSHVPFGEWFNIPF